MRLLPSRSLRFLLLGLAAAGVAITGSIRSQERAAPAQPVPFSHKLHTTGLELQCADCHAMPEPGDAAGFPEEAYCMRCHSSVAADSPAVAKLREYFSKGEPVPWVRLYRVPDFVYFSHEVHVGTAGLACKACHGAVSEHDVLTQEQPTSMKWCVDCHRKMGASAECNLCHNPG